MRAVSDTDTLGAELRAAREGRDLSLEQVEKQTRIRIHYLAALEADEYADLPSAVQARGFLRNYARFLGLDADNLEARFNAALYNQARRGHHTPVFEDDPTPTLPSVSRRTSPRARASPTGHTATNHESVGTYRTRRASGLGPSDSLATSSADERARARRVQNRNMTLGTVGIATVSLLAFALVVLYMMRNNLSGSNSPIFSPLPPTGTTMLSPTNTATSDSPSPLPNPNATLASAAGGATSSVPGVAILITVRERTPLRIVVDDQVVYNGVPVPITSFKYQAKTSVQIHTGDAGAIDVVVNGIQQPPLGPSHAIADKTYTAGGVSTANPTANTTSATPSYIQTADTITPGFKP